MGMSHAQQRMEMALTAVKQLSQRLGARHDAGVDEVMETLRAIDAVRRVDSEAWERRSDALWYQVARNGIPERAIAPVCTALHHPSPHRAAELISVALEARHPMRLAMAVWMVDHMPVEWSYAHFPDVVHLGRQAPGRFLGALYASSVVHECQRRMGESVSSDWAHNFSLGVFEDLVLNWATLDTMQQQNPNDGWAHVRAADVLRTLADDMQMCDGRDTRNRSLRMGQTLAGSTPDVVAHFCTHVPDAVARWVSSYLDRPTLVEDENGLVVVVDGSHDDALCAGLTEDVLGRVLDLRGGRLPEQAWALVARLQEAALTRSVVQSAATPGVRRM